MTNPLEPLNQQTILRQVECPLQTKSEYDAFGGVKFMFGEAFPEMIGYLFAYNFSGLGSNDKGFFGKMGLDTTSVRQSKRLLGYNYFLPMNGTKTADSKRIKCSVSSGVCANKDPYYYMRTYSVARGGNFTFGLVEDLLDLNPVSVIKSVFASSTGSVECIAETFPVGSNFDFCDDSSVSGKKLGYQKTLNYDSLVDDTNGTGYTAHKIKVEQMVQECDNECETKFKNSNDKRAFIKDNCKRDCRRIWWEEKRCIPKPDFLSPPVKYTTCGANEGSKEYRLPFGSSYKHTEGDKPRGLDKTTYAHTEKEEFQSFRASRHLYAHHYQCIGQFILIVLLGMFILLLCVLRR
jgi:hypothetical protein